MARLQDPAFYISRTNDGYPLQIGLPEGVTMPVFARSEDALEWMDAHGLGHDTHSVEGFHTLEDVQRFTDAYGSEYEYITINPAPDPNVSPIIQPFGRLLEIAASGAR